jgi:hypothetical protein
MGRYGGMTVKERVVAAELMEAWNRAAKARNRDEMLVILARVELADLAPGIVDTVLANPAKYGF